MPPAFSSPNWPSKNAAPPGARPAGATLQALDATYRFDEFKSKKDEIRRPLKKITFAVERRNELAQAEEALSAVAPSPKAWP